MLQIGVVRCKWVRIVQMLGVFCVVIGGWCCGVVGEQHAKKCERYAAYRPHAF